MVPEEFRDRSSAGAGAVVCMAIESQDPSGLALAVLLAYHLSRLVGSRRAMVTRDGGMLAIAGNRAMVRCSHGRKPGTHRPHHQANHRPDPMPDNVPVLQRGVRQLLINDAGVAELHALRRVLHQPRKYLGNPLLVGHAFHDRRRRDRDTDEGTLREGGAEPVASSIVMPGSVVRGPGGTFQMYYHTKPLGVADFGYGGGTPAVAYAESHNGIHWSLPALDRVALQEGRSTNLLFEPPGSLPCAIIDEHDPDDARRYKMLYYPSRLSCSPDGINWSEAVSMQVPSRIGRSDGLNSLVGWDPRLHRYVAYLRPQVAHADQAVERESASPRLVARTESEDLEEWSTLETVIEPDADDPPGTEFQTMGAFLYQGLYLGVLCVHEGYPEERYQRHPKRAKQFPVGSAMLGRCFLELVTSKDGISWTRTHQPFLDTTPGGLDSGLLWPTNAPVLVDDELWFYYGMAPHDHALGYSQAPGLAKLRRDGFAGMAAGAAPGWLVTEPFICPGGRLRVNANAAGGELSVAVLEADGMHAIEFAKPRCAVLDGDAMAYPVTWYERASLDALIGQEIRLKFYLREAELFSFWLD
jgi:hypothetical protein